MKCPNCGILFMTSIAYAERCEECGIVVVKEEQ